MNEQRKIIIIIVVLKLQVRVEKNKVARKLLGAEEFSDYASPEHNRRHEPRIGSPGGRA